MFEKISIAILIFLVIVFVAAIAYYKTMIDTDRQLEYRQLGTSTQEYYVRKYYIQDIEQYDKYMLSARMDMKIVPGDIPKLSATLKVPYHEDQKFLLTQISTGPTEEFPDAVATYAGLAKYTITGSEERVVITILTRERADFKQKHIGMLLKMSPDSMW